jgi:uncharacterized protein (DUF433 family)
MQLIAKPEAPPLREEPAGVYRVGNTRVLLELVIHAFNEGATAEEIVFRYPTLSLADVFGVIAYYLRHRVEVDAYIAESDRLGDIAEAEADARNADLVGIRERLLARRNAP